MVKAHSVTDEIENVFGGHPFNASLSGFGGDSDILKLTFFGEHKAIAEVNSLSSSGSGWCYGACVTLRCRETGEEHMLTSY